MTLVIGTDEAGYGPNLGPLVVSATAWRVAAAPAAAEAALAAGVAAAVAATGVEGLLWGDSKRIYRGGAGFAALERGALAGVAVAGGTMPRRWPALDAQLGGLEPGAEAGVEAEALATVALPLAADPESCAALAGRLAARLADHGIVLAAVRCRALQPAAFNQMLAAGLNKSDILSRITLDLAAGLRAAWADEPALVWCDRHGGRRSYAGLLARHFDTPLVRPLEETPDRSAYEMPTADCRAEFHVGGESRIPVALASMTAKYVRELSMQGFNAFWESRAPGLRGTAGYPVDAARWRREAAEAVRSAGIDWDRVWRRV